MSLSFRKVELIPFEEVPLGRTFRARKRYYTKSSTFKAQPIEYIGNSIVYEQGRDFSLKELVALPAIKYY